MSRVYWLKVHSPPPRGSPRPMVTGRAPFEIRTPLGPETPTQSERFGRTLGISVQTLVYLLGIDGLNIESGLVVYRQPRVREHP